MRCLIPEESGQVLPLVGVMMLALIGITALSVDVGRAFYSQRELQAATDSAALAGAQVMLKPGETPAMIVTNSAQASQSETATGSGGVAGAYSAMAGGFNQKSTLPQVAESATLKCYSSLEALGQPCVGAVPYNAIQVTQTAVLPMYFAGLFGKPNVTISAVATASARGGPPKPSNVAIILDTTLSEDAPDTNCKNAQNVALTEMQCSLNGVQVLLKALQPCGINQATCSPTGGVASNSFDRVALFTFPNVTPSTAVADTSCTSSIPSPTSQNGFWNMLQSGTGPYNINYSLDFSPQGSYPITPWSTLPVAAAYTFPLQGASSYAAMPTPLGTYPTSNGSATYQITAFLSDYRTSDAATTLNPNSTLVKAAGGVSGCGGMAPPNWAGMYGTYYAGAIYAAQAALTAEQASNPGSENVLIVISDGDATAGFTSPSSPGQTWDGYFPVMPSSGVTNPANAAGTYPSWIQECNQGVAAANYATSQNTTVYAVAYGAGSSGCSTDSSPRLSPCNAMAQMASAPQEFYSDYLQSGSDPVICDAGQPVVQLQDIFAVIANDLTEPRLIPNNTT